MTKIRPAIHRAPIILITFLMTLTTDQVGFADQTDPTQASDVITGLLTRFNQMPEVPPSIVVPDAEPPYAFPEIRLQAMVLRDPDHGSALISFGNESRIFVPLRRSTADTAAQRFTIDNVTLVLEDFSPHTILMRRLDTNEPIFIR